MKITSDLMSVSFAIQQPTFCIPTYLKIKINIKLLKLVPPGISLCLVAFHC